MRSFSGSRGLELMWQRIPGLQKSVAVSSKLLTLLAFGPHNGFRRGEGSPLPRKWYESLVRRARNARVAAVAALSLLAAACSGIPGGDYFGFNSQPPPPPAQPSQVRAGQAKVAPILPLSASGNAAAVAASMRNAAEMALAEFSNPDIQLLVKDDGGTAGGAQAAAN